MSDRDNCDIRVQPTLFGAEHERRVFVNGRMAATIQKIDEVWRIVIPFGRDHEPFETMEEAVDAVVSMARRIDTTHWT